MFCSSRSLSADGSTLETFVVLSAAMYSLVFCLMCLVSPLSLLRKRLLTCLNIVNCTIFSILSSNYFQFVDRRGFL